MPKGIIRNLWNPLDFINVIPAYSCAHLPVAGP